MKFLKVLPVIIALFSVPVHSHGWSLIGHRVVGHVAESYLTPKAKAAVKQILGNESIAITANWADFIKSDTSLKHLDPWHYVNLPDSLSYPEVMRFLSNDGAINVYTKTTWLIKELRNKKLSRDKQAFYLKLLIHFIGDIHQPMHTARESDRGGNNVKVTWFGQNTNLHTVWDRFLIQEQELSYTEYTAMINHATAAQRATWQKAPVKDWIYESYVISREIYMDTPPDSKLSYNYNYKWISTVNQQLLKGGVRLAGVLNDIFK